MKMFEPGQWLFSLKLFITAMIAYAISVRLGLPQSYWSIVTCCVVMNPVTGAIRSKGVYRFMGTVTAGMCSVLLATAFASVPIFMIAGAGLLTTAAFCIALLDRTPRAYGFQLFGVTLLLVAVAGVDHPENMFNMAVARVCEISVGIVCCTIVDSIWSPRSLSPMLTSRLDTWLRDVGAWMDDALCGRAGESEKDRKNIVADVTAMSGLAGQLAYDPGVSRRQRQIVFAMQRHLLRLIPLLTAHRGGCRHARHYA